MKIPSNRVTCVVGESGSGKSTLLKLLNKMLIPDKGEILFQNQHLDERDAVEHRREVIMVAQTPLIFSGSIEENLQKGKWFSDQVEATEEELKHSLQVVHLHKSLDENVKDLSGGEKQRVALARALLINPKVYLLDEPTSALDEETEIKVLSNIIQEVKKRSGTVIMVTHSKTAWETFGEHIIHIGKR